MSRRDEENAKAMAFLILLVLAVIVIAVIVYLIVVSAAATTVVGAIAGAGVAVKNYFKALFKNVQVIEV